MHSIRRNMFASKHLNHRIDKTTLYKRRIFSYCAFVVIFIIECILLQPVVSEINHNEFLAQLKVPQCRKDCLDKVSSTDQPTIFLFISLLSCLGRFLCLFLDLISIFRRNQKTIEASFFFIYYLYSCNVNQK